MEAVAGTAEHVRWLVAAVTAVSDDNADEVLDHFDVPAAAAAPEFMTAATLLAHFLVGWVCHASGQDVPAVLRELGAWAAHLPD